MLKSNNSSNKTLMDRVKHSDDEAFMLLYNRLWDIMYTRAYSMLGDENICKDIVQDVWVSIWERRYKISSENIEGYLLKAVRFKVYNEFRNNKYKNKFLEQFVQEINHDTNNNVEQAIQLKETEKQIFTALNDLPKKCKNVFKLSRFDGMKNKEIAEKLNISKRTVETHISNALKILKGTVLFVAIIL